MSMQAQRGGEGTAQTYTQPGTRKRWAISTTLRPLYPQKRYGICRTGG